MARNTLDVERTVGLADTMHVAATAYFAAAGIDGVAVRELLAALFTIADTYMTLLPTPDRIELCESLCQKLQRSVSREQIIGHA